MTVSDYPDWQTPQAHATAIANTGVPLLRMTNNSGTASLTSLAGGATVTLVAPVVVNQPGWEASFIVWFPSASGTLPFLQLAFIWIDSASGLTVFQRNVVITAGNGASNPVRTRMWGPVQGDTLQVVAFNLDPAVTATFDWTVNQTSHVFEHDWVSQGAYAAVAPNGFVNPLGTPTTNLLVKHSPTIAASGTDKVLCATWLGDVDLNIDNTASAGSVTVQVMDPAGFASGTVGATLFKTVVPLGGTFSQSLTLPATPVILELQNTATIGSITPSEILIAQLH